MARLAGIALDRHCARSLLHQGAALDHCCARSCARALRSTTLRQVMRQVMRSTTLRQVMR